MNLIHRFPVRWSTVMVITFAVILATVGFFAEVFQAPSVPQEMAQLITNPLPVSKLQRLRSLSFTNKSGLFKFENTHPDGASEGPWRMLEPTSIKARKDFFVKVVQALSELQVRNVHRADSINLKSFSLDRPLFTLTLAPVDGVAVEVAFGLLNPIDNTTYFKIKDQEWIYQSLALPLPLETVTVDELLDSRALAFSAENLDSLEISPNGVKLIKIGGVWQNQDSSPANQQKVEQLLKELQTLKSYMVLDKLDADQALALQEIMQSPQWRLRLGQGETSEVYLISPALDRVGSYKLERSGSHLLYREGTLTPIVLGREQMGVFSRRDRDLK